MLKQAALALALVVSWPGASSAVTGGSLVSACNAVFAPSFDHTGSVLVALLGLLLTMAWRENKQGEAK